MKDLDSSSSSFFFWTALFVAGWCLDGKHGVGIIASLMAVVILLALLVKAME